MTKRTVTSLIGPSQIVRTGEHWQPLIFVWNQIASRLVKKNLGHPSVDPGLLTVRRQARTDSDISSHLETIYLESCLVAPRLMVELGVRGGETTRTLAQVARRTGAALISVDVEPSDLEPLPDIRWDFVLDSSIDFGRRFATWVEERGLPAQIDVLLLDTSHLLEESRKELAAWLPLVSPGGVVFLHDTCMRLLYRRRNGTLGYGWDNSRGVIRALEEYLRVPIDENRRQCGQITGSWQVAHDPLSSGLTILRRFREDERKGGSA